MDVDKLPLSPKYKTLIKDGENGEYGGDRSRAVFGVLCRMVRAGCSDGEMMAVITNKELKISDHIYDQKNPSRCAENQIGKSREQVEQEREALQKSIETLTNDSKETEIEDILKRIHQEQFSPVKKERLLQLIKTNSGIRLHVLQKQFREVARPPGFTGDTGYNVAQLTLNKDFGKGKHLIRTADGSFWEYTGTHWKRITDDLVSNRIIGIIEQMGLEENYASIASQAQRLLKGMQAKDGDPLRLAQEPRPIINCKNGELWLDDKGNVELREHRYDSYLPYCLDVEYDPKATCPQYDEAVLGIFREVGDYSSPQEMVDHWHEWLGYVIQPRRDIPAYLMLNGGGSNGKNVSYPCDD